MRNMRSLKDTLKKLAGPVQLTPVDTRVTFRHAGPADAQALTELAQLDSSRAPRGDVIVADAGGELWAAVSLDDGHAVANPFRPSGELTWSLMRARPRAQPRAARQAAPHLEGLAGRLAEGEDVRALRPGPSNAISNCPLGGGAAPAHELVHPRLGRAGPPLPRRRRARGRPPAARPSRRYGGRAPGRSRAAARARG